MMTSAGHGSGPDAAARSRRAWDRAAPSYDRQIAFFERTWFAGGREWLTSRARGRVLEVAIGTGRNLPGYPSEVALTVTRRQLPLVQSAGFQIVERERLKAGTIERIHAVKPA